MIGLDGGEGAREGGTTRRGEASRRATESAELAGGSLARNRRRPLQSLESAFRGYHASPRSSVSRSSRTYRRLRPNVTAQSCPAPSFRTRVGHARALTAARLAGNARRVFTCLFTRCQRRLGSDPPSHSRIGISLRAVCNSAFLWNFLAPRRPIALSRRFAVCECGRTRSERERGKRRNKERGRSGRGSIADGGPRIRAGHVARSLAVARILTRKCGRATLPDRPFSRRLRRRIVVSREECR